MDYRFLRESLGNYIFFKNILQKYEPKCILETGTNAGIFGWFCYKFLDEFELHTVDKEGYCKFFVNHINNSFDKNNIHFYEDRSPECLNRNFFHMKFDLAFLDAGHSYEQLLGEMKTAADLNIPVLIVDDWSNENLDRAITDFVKETSYSIVDVKAGTEGSEITKVGYVKVLENS